jgi:type III secretory pathway component EscT
VSLFEAIMLICFGVSRPISVAKSIRTRVVTGKSPLFMAIVCIGYFSGLIHKVVYSFDFITILYAINLIMVAAYLLLYYKYLPEKTRSA